jgi:titin
MFFRKLLPAKTSRTRSVPTRRTALAVEALEARDLMAVLTPGLPAPITQTFNPPIAAPAADTEGDSLAPFALTATTVSTKEIDLSWSSDAKPGSASYRFDVCENINGVWKEIGLTNQSSTWKVTGLNPGTSYQFAVGTPDLQFGNGEDYSEVVGKSTLAQVLPPPTNFAGRALSSSQVQLTWTPVAGASAYEIIQYKNGQWVNIARVGATSSYIVPGLSAATTNYFSIATDNVGGTTGSYANYIHVYTPSNVQVTVPTAPTGLTGTALSSSQIQLKWNAVAGATSYTVYYYTGSQWSAFYTTGSTNYSFNVRATGTYYFAVTASNASGTSNLSSWVPVTLR